MFPIDGKPEILKIYESEVKIEDKVIKQQLKYYLILLQRDDKMEIFKKSKTLKIIYKDTSISCTLGFNITDLENAIKKLKVKKL